MSQPAPSKEPTGILIRLSVDRDGKAESPERHEADCRKLAAAKGWTVAKVYTERDVSGLKVNRPVFEELIRDLQAKRIKNVVAWDWSRITRRGPGPTHRFLEAVKDAGGDLATVHQQVDTTTPMGEAIAGFYAAQAKMESEATSRRVTGYHKSRVEKALPHNGGSKPYGHKRDGSKEPAEAPVVRQLFEWIMEGTSRNECARRLNQRGVKTARGRDWSQASVDMLLKQPRLTGYRTYHGKLIPGAYEPIFSEEEFADLQAQLQRTATTRQALNEGLLLRNLLFCGKCGHVLRFQKATLHGKKFPRWACPKLPGNTACGGISIGVERADSLVLEEFIKTFDKWNLLPASEEPSAVATSVAEERKALEAQLADFVDRLAKWDAVFLQGNMESSAWQSGREGLQEQSKALESRLEALVDIVEDEPALPPPGTDLAAWWASVSPDRRRAAVVGSLEAATVHPERNRPANKPRVELKWKSSEWVRLWGRVGERYAEAEDPS